jgi:hypothetical protein
VTTTSVEPLDTVPDEILAAVPETIRKGLRHELTDLTERLGEFWHGGPWHPKDDKYREKRRSHTNAHLNEMGAAGHEDLKQSLTGWSADLRSKRVPLLMLLWLECWGLWDAHLVYRTLRVVAAVVGEITKPSAGESPEDWEPAAWRAVGNAISLVTADADIFQQIVLSNPAELATQAKRGIDTAAAVVDEIKSLLDHPDAEGDPLTARGLRYIELVALESRFFYEFLVAAARALCDFHNWLATAPRLRTGNGTQLPEQHADGEELAAVNRQNLLKSIDDAVDQFHSGMGGLSNVTLSRAEPWEQLLSEIRELAARGGAAKDASVVLVPRRVSIRYCYPFAVQTDVHAPDMDKGTWLAEARKDGRIGKHLNERLEPLGIKVQDVRPLDPTAFFAARGSDSGLYGGVHVELPGITLSTGQADEQPCRCRVWIALSRMGNHCLCVEREPMETALPHVVYQAVAAGTPYVFGVTTALADGTSEATTWDNLHSFGRDVIRAAASADFWRPSQHDDSSGNDQYVRGNLHEVLVIRTVAALATEPDGVAAKLNSALGGRILLKSVQATPTTGDEWVRYPPATQIRADSGMSGITSLPELGLAGDWCAYTGETTVFGIVAAPSWHSDVYTEAAQFASSWSPLLRLWSERLQAAIEEGSKGGENDRLANELRQIERTVRRHLAQIQGEELCATLSHRRFLDRLLEMAGVPRLQEVLESQLLAAERLMDWWSEDARHKSDELRRASEDARRQSEEQQQKSNQRRDKLLGVIALFGMFELGGFLELANSTRWHESFFGLFTLREGIWEDWLVATLFVVALLALVIFYFDFFRLNRWLHPKRDNPASPQTHPSAPPAP